MKTRKIYGYVLALALSATALTSCDSYLDVKTYGQKLPETMDDYEQLLANQLRTFDGNDDQYFYSPKQILKYECYSDNLNASLSTKTSSAYTPFYVGDDLGGNQYRMKNMYGRIKDLNIILGDMPDQDSEKGRKMVAACLTMRGALYFMMMRELCEAYENGRSEKTLGLPLVDQFDIEGRPARASLAQTAAFIERDLLKAIGMGISDDTYRFTADVARAYLARTYFWTQQWDKAIAEAQHLLDHYPLIGGEDYKNMMQATTEKLGNVMLRSFITGSTTTYKNVLTQSKNRPVATDLVKLFTEKKRDIRYTFFFDKKLLNTKGIHMYIRSAEMCLILAESHAHLGHTNEALGYLNRLREKRIEGYTALTEATLPAVDTGSLIKQDCTGKPLTPLMQAILNERRKELYMEGDRWFELKRNGGPEFWVGYNGVKYETLHYLYTYPVSFADLHTNPLLEQNPGYPKLND